jgi:hypothetical protein
MINGLAGKSKTDLQRRRFIALLLGSIILFCSFSACLPAISNLPPPESTARPTASSTSTATIDWFPSTNTPTSQPAPKDTPTPEYITGLGDIILTDDFSSPGSWTLGKTSSGSVALGNSELTIAIHEPSAYEYGVRLEPVLGDFFLQITANPTLCRGEDEYGVLFRMTSPGDFYRFSLACDGRVRLDRVVGGSASSPQPWLFSGAVPSGAPSFSQLAIWVLGKEMRFFANGEFLFSVSDPMLPGGNLGVFARSAGEMAVTVTFSELTVREIEQ